MLGQLLRKKGVSIERLAGLCEIQDAGGIMAAAQGDSSRQSQLSRQIKELEVSLDCQLMDRSSSPSKLNREGETLAAMGRRFLTDFDRVAGGLSQQKIPLRIAASESLVLWYLMPTLAKLCLSEGRSIQFLNMRSRDSSRALSQGRVDLAVSHSLNPSQGIEVRELAGYGLRLVGIEGGRVKKWGDLKRQALATLSGNGKMRKAVEQLVEDHPDGPFIALECTSHIQLLVACETMGAIAVVPEIALVQERAKKLPACQVAELGDERYSVSCGWNEERAKKDDDLRLLIQEVLK
ncbi:LysR family transcriptional regulator [Akkermansiaceae bacterium]|nr:LysR family transcriptional regulator [Akkermansiaceae bacterium]